MRGKPKKKWLKRLELANTILPPEVVELQYTMFQPEVAELESTMLTPGVVGLENTMFHPKVEELENTMLPPEVEKVRNGKATNNQGTETYVKHTYFCKKPSKQCSSLRKKKTVLCCHDISSLRMIEKYEKHQRSCLRRNGINLNNVGLKPGEKGHISYQTLNIDERFYVENGISLAAAIFNLTGNTKKLTTKMTKQIKNSKWTQRSTWTGAFHSRCYLLWKYICPNSKHFPAKENTKLRIRQI